MQRYWYHAADPSRIDKILRDGLRINQLNYHCVGSHEEWTNTPGKLGVFTTYTTSGQKWIRDVYGVVPIFLSIEPDLYEGVVLKVDMRGLQLVADIPSLIDYKANIDVDGGEVWWEEGKEPSELMRYLGDNGELAMEDLIEPSEVARACIRLTKTAACLTSISPDRLTL